MQLTEEIKEYMDRSVLCWLATATEEGIPNVSPKECFTHFGTDRIIVANIASPQTMRNIRQNQNICISFIDVLVQKGFQIHGKAELIREGDHGYKAMHEVLDRLAHGKFPFTSITQITLEKVKPIIAPRYALYPETTEEDQISSSRAAYGF